MASAAGSIMLGPRLCLFPPPLPLPGFDLAMAWHARTQADDGVTWLKDQVRQVAR